MEVSLGRTSLFACSAFVFVPCIACVRQPCPIDVSLGFVLSHGFPFWLAAHTEAKAQHHHGTPIVAQRPNVSVSVLVGVPPPLFAMIRLPCFTRFAAFKLCVAEAKARDGEGARRSVEECRVAWHSMAYRH